MNWRREIRAPGGGGGRGTRPGGIGPGEGTARADEQERLVS